MNAADAPRLDTGKLAAARLWAVNRAPYLASALFGCTYHASAGSDTVAVDRTWRVHADPPVVDGLPVPELGRLLIHLISHLVREHADRADALRIDEQRAKQWNRSTDAEINDDLRAADLRPSVADTVPAQLGCPDGGLAEAYFRDTARLDQQGEGQPWDCGSGADGRPRPWDGSPAGGLPPGQAELLRLGVANEIRRSEAREPGSVPAGWLRWAEAVLPSRTDWRRVLGAEIRKALSAAAGSVDYTYRRVSRRTPAPGSEPRAVLPSLFRPVPNVAVVCDTSGSMDDGLLAQVLAEVEALLTRGGLRSTGLAALAVDTEVHAARRVNRAAQVELVGGGGTDMGEGIAAAEHLRPRPDLIIVLTDGYTPWPDRPPPGIRVVIGLLGDAEELAGLPTPEWARRVVIERDGR